MADINQIIDPKVVLELTKMNNELIQAGKNMDELIPKIKTLQDTTINVGKTTSDNTKKKKELTEAEKEALKIEKQIEDTEKKITIVSDERTKKLNQVRNELTKATASEKQLQKVRDAQRGSIEQLSAVNSILEKRLKAVNLTTEEGRKKAELLRSAIDKNNTKIKENSSALSAQRLNIGNYASALDGFTGKFAALPGPLGRAAGGLAAVGKAMWALVANPIGAIIAAIVVTFTALVSVFKSTDDGGTMLTALWKSMGAILEVLTRRVVLLIDGFAALFSGDFKEAGEKFKETISGIGKELKETTGAAWDYIYAQDALNDRMTAFISENSKARNEIERLLQASKDQTKGDTERMDALQKALTLQDNLSKKKVEFANLEYENELKLAASKAQIDKEELDSFIKMNEKEQMSAMANNKKLAAAWNFLGDEKIKSLETFYSKAVDADTEYFSSTKRTVAQLSGLKKELTGAEKEHVKKRQEFDQAILDYEVKMAEDELKIWAEQINKKYLLGLKEVEMEKAINDLIFKQKTERQKKEEADADASLQAGLDEIAKIKAKKDEQDGIEAEQRKQNTENTINDSIQLGNQLFDLKGNQLQREFEMAEGNAKRQAEINKKIAQHEKQQALFNVAINTAVAVSKVWGQTGIFGVAAQIPVLVMGAVQAALIAGQKIPQFAKGTDYSPAGVALVGERGRELIQTPRGEVFMANNPALVNLERGSKVITNRNTEAYLNDGNIVSELRQTRKAIERIPQPILRNGSKIAERRNNYWAEYKTLKHRLN
jgi:hypothetical protein